jgi:hypothetical protein
VDEEVDLELGSDLVVLLREDLLLDLELPQLVSRREDQDGAHHDHVGLTLVGGRLERLYEQDVDRQP